MKIALANLAPPTAEAVRRLVALAPEHEIVWAAATGAEALALCDTKAPDLLLMGLHVSANDGAEAAPRLAARMAGSILIVADPGAPGRVQALETLGLGTVETIDAPSRDPGQLIATGAPLLAKIRELTRLAGRDRRRPPAVARLPSPTTSCGLVAIGASAGGPSALAALLGALPRGFAASVVIVQHVDERFVSGLAEWLGQQCALPVRLAREGETPAAGTVLVAGGSDHLIFKSADRLGYTPDPADLPHRPSIDVFFQSLGRNWTGRVVGVLLTGMGSDGVRGLKALRAEGHHTIAQNRATSAVYGMPKAAAAAHAAVEILPPEAIAARLAETFGAAAADTGTA